MVTGALSTSYSAFLQSAIGGDWAAPPALSSACVLWQRGQDCISIQQVSLEARGAVKLSKGITQEGVMLSGPRVLEGHILAATLLAV